jgi:predicted O-methyltransferase YrrM
MFNLINSAIQDYCEDHTSAKEPPLYELYRETNLQVLRPRMLSCKSQGTFLEFISRMVCPKRILEVGTYTGYSTICLAKGLAADGIIYTIEYEAELEERIRKYLRKANIEQQTKLFIGDALEIIPTLNEQWDLIFIDADKINYIHYYNMLLPHLSPRGILLADNVLWSGKVTEEVKSNDRDTQAILAFNQHVQNDDRVRNMILPFRDGMMLVMRCK